MNQKHDKKLESYLDSEYGYKKNNNWKKIIIIFIASLFLIFLSKVSFLYLWLRIALGLLGSVGCIIFLLKLSTTKSGRWDNGFLSWWWY